MQIFIYYISLPFIYLISVLPFWVLYRISDFFYFIVFYIVRYRRELVLRNLKKSFPGKSDKEINSIRKRYYRFFTDVFLESVKVFTMTSTQMKKRCKIINPSLLDRMDKETTDFILVTGHFGNWEWAGASISLQAGQTMYALYKPLSNKYFDRLIHRSRKRFKMELVAVKDSLDAIFSYIGKRSAFAFISDQAPRPEKAYWTLFMNQDTPVFKGTELVARKYNLPVIYVSVSRVKRGYYEIRLEELFSNPRKTKKGEVTERYTKRLEEDIRANPEIWLWTHNRWKHKKPEA